MPLAEILLYASAAVYPLLLLAEACRPARHQPPIRGWRLIGAGFFIVYAAIAYYGPLALPPSWLEASLLPGASLGVPGGAVVGYLAVTLVGYAWHRAAHAVPLLWRLFHQLHHAPRRLDVSGSALFHPSEMVFYTLMPLAVTTLGLGLDPVAAGIVGLLGVFNGVFQHSNLRTPRWVTWFAQRPEAHSIHHAHGVHGWNYSDFPLWDRLFGTYRAGDGFQPRVGFDDDAARRWPEMLACRDVHAVTPSARPLAHS